MSSEERVTLNAEGENSKAIYIKENKDGVKIYNEIKKDPIPRFLNPIKVSPKEIIGRETALQELLGLIKQEETVYIHAIRGVGKTTLGKLVYHHLKELDSFSYYAIVELTESFLESFIEKLRVPCRVDVVEGETDEDRLQKILHALTDVVEKDSSEKNGFILIDNALPRKAKGSRDFLKEVIDHLSSNWKILVTSFEEIPYLKEYKLDYLTDEKALELFLFHCPDKGSKEDIQVLLNHVGKHTLTVELMAKTLKTASRIKSVAELFDILKKHELGKNPSARKKIHANHPKGEVIAFEYISKIFDMTELENEKNLIYALKNYYFLPDYISKEDFGDMVKTEDLDENTLDEATEELYKRGWLEKNGEEEEYRLHSIIKEVVYDKLNPGYEDCKALVSTITTKLSASRDNPLANYYLIEQARAISDAITETNEDLADLELWLGNLYQSKGEYDEAVDYLKKAQKKRIQIHGDRHEEVATTYNNIGEAYRNKGEYDKAIEYYKKELDIRLEKLGERHPDVATTYNNIGGAYESKGEYDKAIEYYEKDLEISIEKLGERHPSVATTYNNIGSLYYNQKRYQESMEMFAKAIDILKDYVPESHPNMQTMIGNYNHVKRLAEGGEEETSDDIDLPTIIQLIQQMDAKFQEAGEIEREEFKQFAQLHLILAVKLKEAGETEGAGQVLARAKELAEQLGDEELLALIGQVED